MNNAIRSTHFDFDFFKMTGNIINQRAKIFGFIILGALLAFEIFNYSTTEFALKDTLGDLAFLGVSWATILAVAFCGIDFAGVARLFTPEQGGEEPAETWYLFGAWILAAIMNASLTWWGVSVAISNHISQSQSVMDNKLIHLVVPIFVAVLVLVIRIMIIGTFSISGEKIFGQQVENHSRRIQTVAQTQSPARGDYVPQRPVASNPQSLAAHTSYSQSAILKPLPRTVKQNENINSRSSEPTYHNFSSSR